MPRIVSVGTAVPGHRVRQEDARALTRQLFEGAVENLDTLLTVFDHAQVQTRYSSAPMEWFAQPHLFPERNKLYVESALDLSARALEDCLSQAGLAPSDVDHLIFVSTTGIATPSLDALLIDRLSMNPHIVRTPIWGLGCAGGIGGLSRAAEFAKARPASRIAVVAVELCTLAFQLNDRSRTNLIATSLFGDGAAAVLVSGDDIAEAGPEIIDHTSTTWPNTLDVMGWDLVEHGLRVVLSKKIPVIVRRHIREIVDNFLTAQRLALPEVEHYITHPGGPRVIDGYLEALDLEESQVAHTRSVLAEFGNMSSPTVLFVLKRFLNQLQGTRGAYGVASAMGPGFSAELLLLKW